MKRLALTLALTLAALLPLFAPAAEPRLKDVRLDGAIVGENLSLTVALDIEEFPAEAKLTLVAGQVALLDSVLPSGLAVRREGEALVLVPTGGGGGWWSRPRRTGPVSVTFAARAAPQGDWRWTQLVIPVAPIRPVTIIGDRPDLEIRIDGARELKREAAEGGKSRTTAFLAQEARVGLGWKTAIRRLDSELMTACDAVTVARVGGGALRFKTIYTYQIAQGALTELSFALPDVTITQVAGEDIQDWRVDRTVPAAPKLRVTLGRPQRDKYVLTVECERPLPAFPCTLAMPVLVPQNVIRAGGHVLVGTDSAIRIQSANVSGLTQIDQTAFPREQALALPQRNVYSYQYAALPYTLSLALDDIVTALNAEIGLVAKVAEGELTVEAAVQVEVRDAPAREVKLFTDADTKWTIAAVTGPQVAESDVDIRTVPGGREIVVPFRQPVSDTVLLNLRLEQPFAADRASFGVPRLSVPAARQQRGYIVVAAGKGLRLVPRTTTELRDVHTASTPVRIDGAQLAYRFREAAWALDLGVERAKSAIHSEVFHLVSLGEGVMYVSAAITCHISGAPVANLSFRVPAVIAALDVVGAGIENWTRSNDVCTVQLANRTMGDYTLLLSYDRPLNYRGADLRLGEI